uniref:Uncharacterized protein n=1 Tax=uncultured bacterium contig00038 TaxID=1181526 RepID=A0A806KFQ8_9BACT|nr:hypothetical protein [uncultured bacterium contig00038]
MTALSVPVITKSDQLTVCILAFHVTARYVIQNQCSVGKLKAIWYKIKKLPRFHAGTSD